jgi:hypothetical protein
MISILSKAFITHIGFRYFPFESGYKSNTLFVGAVIGMKEDVLFLDPLAIGHIENYSDV